MSDWASAETQNGHRAALQLISQRLDSLSGDFKAASEAQAVAALSELDSDAFNGDNSLGGYRSLKGYITQSYFATEAGAEELKWVAIPGRWIPALILRLATRRIDMAEAEFDAIVVGSGMSGGMSAKELCERGLKVLVLERGPEIVPERDYTDQLAPWKAIIWIMWRKMK